LFTKKVLSKTFLYQYDSKALDLLKGDVLFLFTKFASEDAKIISIDLPGGPFGGWLSCMENAAF